MISSLVSCRSSLVFITAEISLVTRLVPSGHGMVLAWSIGGVTEPIASEVTALLG